MAMSQQDDQSLIFKYRLANCIVQKRIGNIVPALTEANELYNDVKAERARHPLKTEMWSKMTKVRINVLRERINLFAEVENYREAKASLDTCLTLQGELYGREDARSDRASQDIKAALKQLGLEQNVVNIKVLSTVYTATIRLLG